MKNIISFIKAKVIACLTLFSGNNSRDNANQVIILQKETTNMLNQVASLRNEMEKSEIRRTASVVEKKEATNKIIQRLLSVALDPNTSENKLRSLIRCQYEEPAIKSLELWNERFHPDIATLKVIFKERLCLAVRHKMTRMIKSHSNVSNEDISFLIVEAEDYESMMLLWKLNPSINLLWRLWKTIRDKGYGFSSRLLEKIGEMVLSDENVTEDMFLELIRCRFGYVSINAFKVYVNRFKAPLERIQELQKKISSLDGIKYPDVYSEVATALIRHEDATETDLVSVIIKERGYKEIVFEAWQLLQRKSPSLGVLWKIYSEVDVERKRCTSDYGMSIRTTSAMAVICHPDATENQLLLITSDSGEQAFAAWNVLQNRFHVSTETLADLLTKPIQSNLVDEVCRALVSRQDAREKDLLLVASRAYEKEIVIQALDNWKDRFSPTNDRLFDYWLNGENKKNINDWLVTQI